MKTIVVKLKTSGSRLSTFTVSDDLGTVLGTGVTKRQLISGVSYSIADSVKVITLTSTGIKCCNTVLKIPVTTASIYDLAAISYTTTDTASMWRHLTDTTLYNNYYGCVAPYIIEYPFAYKYQDEILQNIQDYSKVYKYLPSVDGVFDDSRKIETDDKYFNKAVLYNGQQSSGYLELVAKPSNNLKAYLSYPKINTESKSILFTKSDNFYQYNTFWSVSVDKTIPLFTTSCESLSIDKMVNQSNMDYSSRSFRKAPLRAKDLKVRHILDNTSDVHIVSQFVVAPSQISYK